MAEVKLAGLRRVPLVLKPDQVLPAEKVPIGRKPVSVKKLEADEYNRFVADYLSLIYTTRSDILTVDIKKLMSDNLANAIGFMRAVRERVERSYAGRWTTSDELVVDIVRAIDVHGGIINTWRQLLAVGVNNWWDQPAAPGTPMALNRFSGVMIMGYLDALGNVNAVDWARAGDDFPSKGIDFGQYILAKEPVPLVALPEETLLGTIFGVAPADSLFQPIAIKITTADRLRAPAVGAIF